MEAQRLLEGVLARAAAANAGDDWLHWVDEVVLFGSFSRPGDGPVGDVDLAVVMTARQPHAAGYERRGAEIARRETGRATGDPRRLLVRHLRGGSRRLDLFDSGPAALLPPGAEPVVVYRRAP